MMTHDVFKNLITVVSTGILPHFNSF
jgi:hypothetical protein